ncbi:MAG: FG-GAP repeat protein [Phycisphaerales bacterium]|nr:FG-GAP repeat protein [Phycisphaerales bacterium]
MLQLTLRPLAVITLSVFGALTAPALGQVIIEDFKVLPNDGESQDRFGHSIAIDNGILAVGSRFADESGPSSGSAYLFNAMTGAQIIELIPDDGFSGQYFGISVAIDNGVVAVGAWNDMDNGLESGAAYLFDASSGVQIAKLLPDDGEAYDRFGQSIAIGDGLVVVGAQFDDDNGDDSGSAYVFSASSGGQLAKLLPDDGEAGDNFGNSVGISNGAAVVGAYRNDDNGLGSGSAYLFDASGGTQIAKLLADDATEGDEFGFSVAIDDGIVVVGAWEDNDNGFEAGSAYLFVAPSGSQITKLLPNDGASQDKFGVTVAIDNGFVAVGAWNDNDSGPDAGSAYVFDTSTNTQIVKLLASDGDGGDLFSSAIAISNDLVAVGAMLNDDNGSSSGSAYVFTAPLPECLADLTDDGILNFFDISTFLNAFNAQNPTADFTNDGIYNFFDVSAFLQAFAAGCP